MVPDDVVKLEHETTRPFIADVTTTERVEVRQLTVLVRGGMLVTVKGPHVPLEELVRQDSPNPGGPCASVSVDPEHTPTDSTFHTVYPAKLPTLQR